MKIEQVIKLAEENIAQAIEDYGAHTEQTAVLDDISRKFIKRLAKDSTYAKWELRELFRKSPVWDEKLSALVINGTRTHNPDYNRIFELAQKILEPAVNEENRVLIHGVCRFFSEPESEYANTFGIQTIKRIAPKAYAPNKKLSRVFKAVCVELGVADETAGSEFQRLYAQFADELTAKKIGFKLYVSINPAHFLTMSNPKGDTRGTTLTSCHSFNSTDYEYNNGCSGYARDFNTFIVFTVADPGDPETFNNRKTTRQIFAYKPGNGLLIQSRMYNTSGGTRGAQEDSKLYRDLIQREISMLEDAPNLWKTYPIADSGKYAFSGCGFGGYPDWIHKEFDGKASVRADHAEDYEDIVIGNYGLCICCADETSNGLYCSDCEEGDRGQECYICQERYSEEDLYEVYDRRGNQHMVCEHCRNENHTVCDCCGDYFEDGALTEIGCGRYVCDDCLNSEYSTCADCGEYCENADMYNVRNSFGHTVCVCEDCYDENYVRCEMCGEYVRSESAHLLQDKAGEETTVCGDCYDEHRESEYVRETEVESV